MERSKAIAVVEAINSTPGFQSNYGEAGTAIDLLEIVSEAALDVLDECGIRGGQSGTITLEWSRPAPTYKLLRFKTQGYSGVHVTLDQIDTGVSRLLLSDFAWPNGPDSPGELFVTDSQECRNLVNSLFAWHLS